MLVIRQRGSLTYLSRNTSIEAGYSWESGLNNAYIFEDSTELLDLISSVQQFSLVNAEILIVEQIKEYKICGSI